MDARMRYIDNLDIVVCSLWKEMIDIYPLTDGFIPREVADDVLVATCKGTPSGFAVCSHQDVYLPLSY